MPHHQVASLHTGYATANSSDVKSQNVASLKQAEYFPLTTGRPHTACEQSAQVYAWSVSYPSSQPHSSEVTCLRGDEPLSGGQDTPRKSAQRVQASLSFRLYQAQRRRNVHQDEMIQCTKLSFNLTSVYL